MKIVNSLKHFRERLLLRCMKGCCRSSHQKCSIRKDVLRNFAKFTGKRLCQSLFFLVIFAKFLKTPFLQNSSRRLLLVLNPPRYTVTFEVYFQFILFFKIVSFLTKMASIYYSLLYKDML